MLISELQDEISTHIQDPARKLVQVGQLLIFINSASRDLRNSGWLLRIEEDESLTQVAETYTYTIPATFAFISSVRVQNLVGATSVYEQEVPHHQWEIGFDGGNPIIRFFSYYWSPEASDLLKVVGQKRPTIYTADTETVDVGVESFLRERAISHAARMLSPGSSEMAQRYSMISETALRNSEILLRQHPQAYRQDPDARHVPGR